MAEVKENFSDKLGRFLGASFLFHIVSLVLIFLWQSINLSKTKTNLIMISHENSVRVDVVAMPKHTLKELKNMNISPEKNVKIEKQEIATKSNENSDIEFKKSKNKKSFLSMLKNLSQKEVEKPKDNSKKNVKQADSFDRNKKILSNLLLAGNKVSMGSSIVGSSANYDAGELSSYIEKLPVLIRPFWKLPSYLMNKDLKCRVQIFINESGRLIKAKIFESSGNEEYDSRALKAVKQAQPFPSMSENIKGVGVNGSILLGFPI